MKTPTTILKKFEKAVDGIDYGTVSLSLIVKQGKYRYVLTKQESFLPSNDESMLSELVGEDEKNS